MLGEVEPLLLLGAGAEITSALQPDAAVTLAEAGFRGYEISNWARPGHESRHNLAYWQRRPHDAVGPGAHAFDGASRRWNAARLDGYVAALRGPRPARGGPPDDRSCPEAR